MRTRPRCNCVDASGIEKAGAVLEEQDQYFRRHRDGEMYHGLRINIIYHLFESNICNIFSKLIPILNALHFYLNVFRKNGFSNKYLVDTQSATLDYTTLKSICALRLGDDGFIRKCGRFLIGLCGLALAIHSLFLL